MAFENSHSQPGRRFAKGCNWDDIVLGAFGFVAHLMLFCFVGGLVVFLSSPEVALIFLVFCGVVAFGLLGVRAAQVGGTTTKESIEAIKVAWKGR